MLEELIFTLIQNKEKEQALSLLSTLEKIAWKFDHYDELAKIFFKLKLYPDAIRNAETTVITAFTNEQLWAARCNLINVYNHANEPEKALRQLKICEQIIPGDLDNLLEKAFSYFLLNEKDKAEEILLSVLSDPSRNISEEMRTKILFNTGTYLMGRDEFQKGLRLFLIEGKKLNYWQKATLPFKFWEGGVYPGKILILFAEAGIGDEIINVRFMNHIQKLGMRPIWLTDRKDLASIFSRSGFETITDIKTFIRKNKIDKESLLWTYPMTLPVYLNLEYKDLWYGSYLKPDPFFIEKTSFLFSNSIKKKVGIRWAGNPEYDHDLHRSVPLKEIMDCFPDKNNYAFYSLQRDVGLEELVDFPEIKDLSEEMKTFEETLAIIDQLDLVITSCTSIAHASAALGKPTYIFIPISAYYIYTNSWGEKTPWYGDNVTVLRQTVCRSWKEPCNHLKQKLF